MKLIIAGGTGFVATEIIRQSLSIPKITSVITIARRPVSAPSNLQPHADPSKLRSVVVKDYGSYPDEVTEQLAGADACIWYVYHSSPYSTESLAIVNFSFLTILKCVFLDRLSRPINPSLL